MPRVFDVGTWSDKVLIVTRPSGLVQARVRFRDADGETRIVARSGKTEAAAKTALKKALRDRQGVGGEQITNRTRIDAVVDLWLAQPHGWSAGTERTYGYVAKRVKKAVGGLKVEEATPAAIGRALTKIHEAHPSAAKTARTILTGVFTLAIAHGAAHSNPVRDAPVKLTVPRRKVKSLTRAQADALTDWLRTDKQASTLDLPDWIDWMLGTGCRIGEALAARHTLNADGEPLIGDGTWEIDATVIRIARDCFACEHGRAKHPALAGCAIARCGCTAYEPPPLTGLVIQEHPKSSAGHRIIPLPTHLVAMLERRANELRPAPRSVLLMDERKRIRSESVGVVLPAPTALSLRDPSNTIADLRDALERYRDATDVDLTWVTSHVFRKTAATWLEQAGFGPREIADFLGHAHPSMTLDRYVARSVVLPAAAKALER